MTYEELTKLSHKEAVEYLNGELARGLDLDAVLAEIGCGIADLTKAGFLYIKGQGFKSLSWSESDMTKSYFDMDE